MHFGAPSSYKGAVTKKNPALTAQWEWFFRSDFNENLKEKKDSIFNIQQPNWNDMMHVHINNLLNQLYISIFVRVKKERKKA